MYSATATTRSAPVLDEEPGEHSSLAPVGLEKMRHELVVDASNPVKALVEAVLRERGEEVGEGARIMLLGRPEPKCRAVAQDHVDGLGGDVSRCERQALSPARFAR